MTLFDEQGVRFDVATFLQQAQQDGHVDRWVEVGIQERLKCRVIAIWNEPNVVSVMLKRNCGAWTESLATNERWQAEKK